MLIGGEAGGFSVEDLKTNVQYNGYTADEPYMVAFWEVVSELPPDQQSRFLMFVTSCSRPPLLVLIARIVVGLCTSPPAFLHLAQARHSGGFAHERHLLQHL